MAVGMHAKPSFDRESAQIFVPCVVWCRGAGVMDPSLRAALAGRPELQVRMTGSCFAALAELLLVPAGEVRVLVLEEPGELCGVAEVLARLQRHVPLTKVWVYSKLPRPMLRGLVAGDEVGKSLEVGKVRDAAPPVVKMPRVVVVPGIAGKVAGGGTRKESGAVQGWTPRVVGQGGAAAREGPETQVPDNQAASAGQREGVPQSLGGGAEPSGSFVGGVRPPSLLTDEELSMLLANDAEREHS
jgi:hypothetical protein